jgi:hypothetical protein
MDVELIAEHGAPHGLDGNRGYSCGTNVHGTVTNSAVEDEQYTVVIVTDHHGHAGHHKRLTKMA